jgi:DNA-binding response OmpR family regulator
MGGARIRERGAAVATATDGSNQEPRERLGGARAEFVANLGRRLAELATTLSGLEVDPGSVRLRDDMRRRLHALGAASKLLRFTKLASEIEAGEQALEGAAQRMGALMPAELAELRALLDCAPALAWGQAASDSLRPAAAPPTSVRAPAGTIAPPVVQEATPPQTALVVGPVNLADALTSPLGAAVDTSIPGAMFEVERTDDVACALDLARALAPDVVIIDADRAGAKELVASLLADPMTETVPILVLGKWTKPEDAAPFVAMGVARALPKPVSPDALRRACAETTATYVRREVHRPPLGEVSLDDLGARLSEEIHRGLCDAAEKGRGVRFDLGEGSDVFAAVWGAVARIRDLVTIHSQGGVRFSPTGPEGALPIAPWFGDGASGEARSRDARGGAQISLEGRVVVIADDDPAVTWFLTGVLKSTGAIVHEAHDGERALELAMRYAPDLVISDVLMPHMDGFALCRTLKRDVVLRDTPVILLSWKEDLLQRVRELGADADGYLRKEATATSIVQRVREVIRSRYRVAERIATGGEVRGRLDGLTPYALLKMVSEQQPSATVAVRDATFLYEIEVRKGRPVRATRTTSEGDFQRGLTVLSALLGVGTGRFVITPRDENDRSEGELSGSLDELLLEPIATARAAQRLLSGASLMSAERVDLDESRMHAYLGATPEPARSLIRSLAAGASPRALLLGGNLAPRLLEDVLCDAAAHGAISAISDSTGDDLLFAAMENEVRVLRGQRRPPAPLPEPNLDLGPIIHTSTPAPVEVMAALEGTPEPRREAFPVVASVAPPRVVVSEPVIAEAPVAAAPVIAAPAVASNDARPVEEPARPVVTLGSLTPPPVLPTRETPVPQERSSRDRDREERNDRDRERSRARSPEPSPSPPPTRMKRPSAYAADLADRDAPKKEPPTSRTMWMLFALAGIVFAVGARLARDRDVLGTASVAPVATVEATAQPQAPAPTAAPQEASLEEGAAKNDPILPLEAPLRAEDKVPAGQGLLEIVAGSSDTITIDGTAVGNGPLVRRVLAPRKEPYEVHVKVRGEDRARFVLVKEGRLSRVRVAPPWSR